MTIRTRKETVTFRRPFELSAFDDALPAGSYIVETDEERLEGVSFPAYRRVLAVIHLHAKPGHPGRTQTLTVDPNELDEALKRDQAPEEIADTQDVDRKTRNGTAQSRRDEADRQAIDRGEGASMTDTAGMGAPSGQAANVS